MSPAVKQAKKILSRGELRKRRLLRYNFSRPWEISQGVATLLTFMVWDSNYNRNIDSNQIQQRWLRFSA